MFTWLRQLLRRGHGKEGASAVEFAIILPVLAFLILGGMDLGNMFYVDYIITNASREGARYASIYTGNPQPTSGKVSSYVKTTLNYNSYNLSNFNVSAQYNGTSPNEYVTVTTQAQINWWILGSLLTNPFQLTATTAMTVEGP
jgi:Flp pilus assembly protein TadG